MNTRRGNRSSLPITLIVSILTCVVLDGCGRMKTTVQRAPGASLTALRTYDWLAGKTHIERGSEVDVALLDRRIRRTVDARLERMGYDKRAARPDFLVTYHAILTATDDARLAPSELGYGHWAMASETDVYDRSYDRGSLVLDIVDPATMKLLWRGVAEAEIGQDDTPYQQEERLRQAVHRLLAGFPPAAL